MSKSSLDELKLKREWIGNRLWSKTNQRARTNSQGDESHDYVPQGIRVGIKDI